MLLLTGQVGIGLRALFTPKVLFGSEMEKKNFVMVTLWGFG